MTAASVFGIGARADFPRGVYDGRNAVSFGDHSDSGSMAVTAIWYLANTIYDYDMMFDVDCFPGGSCWRPNVKWPPHRGPFSSRNSRGIM